MEGWIVVAVTSSGLSTARVAASAGCSVQQVRDLEAAGVLGPARRGENGYRRFESSHVRDLVAYRKLAAAVGPVDARSTMRLIRELPVMEAVTLIGDLHVKMRAEEDRVQAAQAALAAIESDDEISDELAADAFTITELGEALGVKASTLRFWEQEGLVAPDRIAMPAGSARRYRSAAIRQARITAALRSGGYRIPQIRAALDALAEFGAGAATHEALAARRRDLTTRNLALLRASSVLAEIVDEASATSPEE